MSTALAITKETIPAYILARAAQAAADNEAALAGVSTGGVPRIKMNGTKFALVNAEGEETPFPQGKMVVGPDDNLYLPVIVLRAKVPLQKAFYLEAYNPNAAEFNAPDCASDDSIRPNAGVSNPQADACAMCPQNAFGSGRDQNGNPTKGKACTDNKIIAVYVANHGVFQLKIPPASLKGFGAYVKTLTGNSIALTDVTTYIGFDPNASFPIMVFEFGGYLPEKFLAPLAEKAASQEVIDIVGPVVTPGSAPATRAIAAPKQQEPIIEQAPEPKKKDAPKTTRGKTKGGITPVVEPAGDGLDDLLGGVDVAPEAPADEPQTQDAGPTDDDLAAALGL